MGTRVGRQIVVGDVLSKSTSLLRRYPALLIPQIIVLIVSLAEDLASVSQVSVVYLLLLLVSIIVSIIVTGAYPSLVKADYEGRPASIGHALRHAASRFWTLLFAGILVGIIVFVGFILVVIPGIIFLTWYVYTVPAIMLEDKGALSGMSASKAFGRDKKWKTFILFIIFIVAVLIVTGIGDAVGLASPLAGRVITSLLQMPVDAWFAVMITYTYLAYGPSSEMAQPGSPEIITPGVIPPPPSPTMAGMAQPGAPMGQPAKFCKNCGAPVEPGAMFCPNCGKPL